MPQAFPPVSLTVNENIVVCDLPGLQGIVPGDATGDGNINVLDMTKVARIILLLDERTPGADANQDGEVNVRDMTKIARIILMLD